MGKGLKISAIIIGASLLLFFFVFKDTIKFLELFEEAERISQEDSIIKAKYIVAKNLITNRDDTVHFKGLNVINFWAYYCKPCIEEFPMLDSLRLQGYNVYFFTSDTSKNTEKFLQSRPKFVSHFYSDTTVFKKATIIPRTIILRDSLIRRDFISKLTFTTAEMKTFLDTIK